MTENVAHYLESGELPDDPAVLAKLYQEMTGEEAKTESVEVEESASAATGAVEAVEAVEAKDDKEPDGIATKDGKHIISYDVLKSERQQRQDAERVASDLRAEIERLKSTPDHDNLSNVSLLSSEQMDELKEYLPEQYEAIVAQQSNLIAAHQKLAQSERDEQQRQAEVNRQSQLDVQEIIDNNQVLSHWQRNDPEAFEYCVQQDNLLKANPKTANMSMAARFDKVAELALQVYDSPIKGKVEAKTIQPVVAKVAARPAINSLSDIPGGDPVEATEMQQFENMSGAAIGNMFLGKTQDQIAAILAKMG